MSSSILASSCDVRKPSKKCTTGIRDSSVAAWAIAAKSITSCTEFDDRNANPVFLAVITSLWSPKIDSAWVATALAATWKTVGVNSPAILNMFGSMSRRPCDEVNVVDIAPACRAPWTAPAAPPSLCISVTDGIVPQRFVLPTDAHSSESSPIPEEGVIG